MKAISLWEPWASLVMLGAKRIETRSWSTRHRGAIAIHAGKRTRKQDELLCLEPGPIHDALKLGGQLTEEGDETTLTFHRGAIVAVAFLASCLEIPPGGRQLSIAEGDGSMWSLPPRYPEYEFGNYEPGRWAWLLRDVRSLRKPIPYIGGQRLFNVPDELFKGRRFLTRGIYS